MGINQIYFLEDGEYKEVYETKQSMEHLVQHLIEEKAVKRFVNIGPGATYNSPAAWDIDKYDINMCESIDTDPMLTWFWPAIKAS